MKEELKINKNEMILKYKFENTGKFRIFGKKFAGTFLEMSVHTWYNTTCKLVKALRERVAPAGNL